MNMRRYLFLISFLLMLATDIYASNSVILLLKNGSTVSFDFNKNPMIAIENDLIIKTVDNEVAYPYSSVQRIYWDGHDDIAGIDVLKGSGRQVSFRFDDGSISVSGLSKGERISVYTIDGKMTGNAISADGTADVSLRLPNNSGTVFIIRTSKGLSYKLIRK